MSVAILILSACLGDVPISGYLDESAIQQRIQAISQKPNVKVQSLVKTRGGREVQLITIGNGGDKNHRAILVVGSVQPSHLLGGEMAIRMAEHIAADSTSEAGKKLLESVTFYFIPWPSPDATTRCFLKPVREPLGNGAPSDDDRDFKSGEDPNEDLNGDGVISMMRVADPAGPFREHSSDKRLLTIADAKKNEHGGWRVYSEGVDNDKDKQWNEDAADGVNFNRNFTFKYPVFKPNAGPNQVSEPETRAVADFCFDHMNIVAVYSFGPEDNLTHAWKPEPRTDGERIRTTVASGDAPYFEFVAKSFGDIVGMKDASNPSRGEGSFSEWAYFHYGRWSFASRGWVIPKLDGRAPEVRQTPRPEAKPDAKKEDKSGKENDKKGTKGGGGGGGRRQGGAGRPEAPVRPLGDDSEQLNALRWFDREKIDGFIPWKKLASHPDFPNQVVEVGGFRPFLMTNPPAKELDGLSEKHTAFLRKLAGLLPRLEVPEVKVTALGAGVFRLSAKFCNQGYLPTMSEMGRYSQVVPPLFFDWKLPEKTTFIQGNRRGRMETLAGNGATVEREWLIRAPEGSTKFHLKVGNPTVGWVEKDATVSK